MKTFYLLKLQNNANKVLAECKTVNFSQAVKRFNSFFYLSDGPNSSIPIDLDENGYRKGDPLLGETVSYCVAERHAYCQYV